MRLFLVMVLFATVPATLIIHPNKCGFGHKRLNDGSCRPVFDEDYHDPSFRTVTEQERVHCDCVLFYQCRWHHMNDERSRCKASEVCCKRGAPIEKVCGWGVIGMAINETRPEEFPWVVAILDVATNETWSRQEYIGGGSIIHPRFVLTAAHKVMSRQRPTTLKEMKCRAGQWMRLAYDANVTQDRLVSEINIHPAYDRQFLANDVALLKLVVPFDVSQPAVRPVCVGMSLPSSSECFAMGWGRRQYNSSDQDANKLKKVQVPLVSREVCWRALQSVDDARRRRTGQEPIVRSALHSSLMCAGGLEAQDTCVGDGGSPLVCQLQLNSTHARWAVFGLVAWGVGCGVVGAPGVYVNVGQYHAWIHAVIVPKKPLFRF